MTTDKRSAGRQAEGGRTSRRFRAGRASGVRAAAAGSALCLAAGMGMSMASQAAAAVKQPPPGGFPGHERALPVCISLSGILRLALPLSPCDGAVVFLEIAAEDHPQPPPGIETDVHLSPPVTVAPGGTGTADAPCGLGEVATGGGYTVGGSATAWLVTVDAPTTDGGVSSAGDTPNDWEVTITNTTVTGVTGGAILRQVADATVTAYVVCTKGPKLHHGPRMAPARSAARH